MFNLLSLFTLFLIRLINNNQELLSFVDFSIFEKLRTWTKF